MKTISDLDGFVDICNETELYATEAGCSYREPEGPISIGGTGSGVKGGSTNPPLVIY